MSKKNIFGCILLAATDPLGLGFSPLLAEAATFPNAKPRPGLRSSSLGNPQLRLAGIADATSACHRLGCAGVNQVLPGSGQGAIAFQCEDCRIGSDEEHKQLPGEVCATQAPYGVLLMTLRQGSGSASKRLSARGGESPLSIQWGTDKSGTLPLSYCTIDPKSERSLEAAILQQTPIEGNTIVTFALSIHVLNDRFFLRSDFDVSIAFKPASDPVTEIYEEEDRLSQRGANYRARFKAKRRVNSSLPSEVTATFQAREMGKGKHMVLIVSAAVPFSQTQFSTDSITVQISCANKVGRCKLDRFAFCGRVYCVMLPSKLKTLLYLRDTASELAKKPADLSESIEEILASGKEMDFLRGKIDMSQITPSPVANGFQRYSRPLTKQQKVGRRPTAPMRQLGKAIANRVR